MMSQNGDRSVFWNAGQGTLVRHWPQRVELLPGAWSPDEKSVVVSNAAGTQIVDAVSGKTLQTLPDAMKEVKTVAWSPDGRLLATAGENDAVVQVWGAATGQLKWKTPPQLQAEFALAWSPDSQQIAASQFKNAAPLKIWSADKGTVVKEYKVPLDVPDRELGRHILHWTDDGAEVRFFQSFRSAIRVKTGRSNASKLHLGLVGGVALSSVSPNGDLATHWQFTVHSHSVSGISTPDTQYHLGQFGSTSFWMHDSRRLLFVNANEGNVPFGFDLERKWRMGTLLPGIGPKNVWACIGPDGNYRGGFMDTPGEGTEAAGLVAVEECLIFVGQTDDGENLTLTPAEFRRRFGWSNDPSRARLLGWD